MRVWARVNSALSPERGRGAFCTPNHRDMRERGIIMTRIEIYDSDMEEIKEIAEINGISYADVVEELVRVFLYEAEESKRI